MKMFQFLLVGMSIFLFAATVDAQNALFIGTGSGGVYNTSANDIFSIKGNMTNNDTLVNQSLITITGHWTNNGSCISTGSERFEGTSDQGISGDMDAPNNHGNLVRAQIDGVNIICNVDVTATIGLDLGTTPGKVITGLSGTTLFVDTPYIGAITNYGIGNFVDVGNDGGLKRAVNDSTGNEYVYPVGNDSGYVETTFQFDRFGLTAPTGTVTVKIKNNATIGVNYSKNTAICGLFGVTCTADYLAINVTSENITEPEHVIGILSSPSCDPAGLEKHWVGYSPTGNNDWTNYMPLRHVGGAASLDNHFCNIATKHGGIYDILDGDYTLMGRPNDPLPVELTYLRATPINNQYIQLDWETRSELNNWYWWIERSTDAANWTPIGRTDGNGTTPDPHTYRYNDSNVVAKTLYYYRLKQIDFDGTERQSNMVLAMIDASDSQQFMFLPNPAAESVYPIPTEKNYRVRVYDISGKLLQDAPKQTSYDISLFPIGMYFFETLFDDESTYTQKIIKQ